MREFKYIVFDYAYPIIFGLYFQHADVARGRESKVTSAGYGNLYVEEDKIRISVHGESISLQKKPGDYDARTLEAIFQDPYNANVKPKEF